MIGRSWRNSPTLWPNWSPKHSISLSNPNSSAFGQTAGDLVGRHARAHQLDRRRRSTRAPACTRRAGRRVRPADHERPVVAGLVADERVDDVEEGLVAGPDDPVAEDVRVRAAALAGDRVDVVDVLRAQVEQALGDVGHELALADARLELLGDHLVGAVDHRAGRVEQDDLVDRLDLARVEHHLLAVSHRDARRPRARRASAARRCPRRSACRRRPRPRGCARISRAAPRNRPASGATAPRRPIIPAWTFSGRQPRAVEPVVLGRRPEVPDVRVAAARQQRVAGHLVACPFADVGARDVADVVEVEQEHRAEVRARRAPRGHARAGRSAAGRRSSALPSRRSSSRVRRSRSSSAVPQSGRQGWSMACGVHACYTLGDLAQVRLPTIRARTRVHRCCCVCNFA